MASIVSATDEVMVAEAAGRPDVKGAQSLFRALDVLEIVGSKPQDLGTLAASLGLSKSTCHRLASALVQRRYLRFRAGEGYTLGPKLLELGFLGQAQNTVVRCARPFLEALSGATADTVHLAVLDGGHVLFLEKISGTRRFEFVSRIGERYAVAPTALGKALILDEAPATWASYFDAAHEAMLPGIDRSGWLEAMHGYARDGYTLDRQESDPNVMCVGAPVRAADGRIAAAISVTSTTKHMDQSRVAVVAPQVVSAARQISVELGCPEDGWACRLD